MKKYFRFGPEGITPILWDGQSDFNPGPGFRLLDQQAFEAWTAANPRPVIDPNIEKLSINPVSLAWQVSPLSPTELEAVAVDNTRKQIRVALNKLDAKTATPAEVQTILAAVIRQIV